MIHQYFPSILCPPAAFSDPSPFAFSNVMSEASSLLRLRGIIPGGARVRTDLSITSDVSGRRRIAFVAVSGFNPPLMASTDVEEHRGEGVASINLLVTRRLKEERSPVKPGERVRERQRQGGEEVRGADFVGEDVEEAGEGDLEEGEGEAGVEAGEAAGGG